MPAEYRRGLLIVWMILTAASSTVVAFATFGDAAMLDGVVPLCEWKQRYGRECPFCGMTTAFFLIGDGQFRAATRTHLASVPLFAFFCVNGLAAVASVFRSKER